MSTPARCGRGQRKLDSPDVPTSGGGLRRRSQFRTGAARHRRKRRPAALTVQKTIEMPQWKEYLAASARPDWMRARGSTTDRLAVSYREIDEKMGLLK
jgi:hypothetical protein